ncbi:MAG TPA: HlyD family efflux transporter periplasmic adaptor subunit [Rhodanobacteraceae bacterium]
MNIAAAFIGALLACASLSGCSGQHAQATSSANTHSRYVAAARGRVAVTGGLLTLMPPAQGTVASVRVHPGEYVAKGAILATLDDAQAQITQTSATAKLSIARANMQLLKTRLDAATKLSQRESDAVKAGAGTLQDADNATAKVAQLKAQLKAAHAQIKLAQSHLAAARLDVSRRTLRAPSDAYVVRILIQPGSSVSTQSAVFTLLPKRPLIVRAELNATYVDAVHPGMRAEVGVSADPSGKRVAAHVVRIGRVFGPNNLDDNPGHVASTRAVVCILAFDKPSAMRVGQRVLVRFMPDKPVTKG